MRLKWPHLGCSILLFASRVQKLRTKFHDNRCFRRCRRSHSKEGGGIELCRPHQDPEGPISIVSDNYISTNPLYAKVYEIGQVCPTFLLQEWAPGVRVCSPSRNATFPCSPVASLMSDGHIVAMTGDGVNDVPWPLTEHMQQVEKCTAR